MRRVVSAVQIEQQASGGASPFLRPLALLEVDADQGLGQAVTGAAIDGVLQAREGGLTGQSGARHVRTATADQLEQRIVSQRVGVVLVLVAARDLQDALAQEHRQRMACWSTPPIADRPSEGRGQSQALVGAGEPDQSAVRGELTSVKSHFAGGCEKIGHEGASWVG